jgi:hypothetical protein
MILDGPLAGIVDGLMRLEARLAAVAAPLARLLDGPLASPRVRLRRRLVPIVTAGGMRSQDAGERGLAA